VVEAFLFAIAHMKKKRKNKDQISLFTMQPDGQLGALEYAHTDEYEYYMGQSVRGDDWRSRAHIGSVVPKKRWMIGLLVLSLVFFLFIGKTAYLQVLQGDYYQGLADGNRIRTYTIVPSRGLIYDRFGDVLADNQPAFALTMMIDDLPDDSGVRDEVLTQAAEFSGMQRTEIDLLITEHADAQFDPIPIKHNIPYESAMRLAIEIASLPGFGLEIASYRSYSSAIPSLSHVLGYVGKINPEEYEEWKEKGYRRVDEIGKTGIELTTEEVLRGKTGSYVVEVDARGNELAIVSKTDPLAGANISLSIDSSLQSFIERRLQEEFDKNGSSRASVIVMDPETGGVRSLVSLPSFDSNSFSGSIDAETYKGYLDDEDQPLFHRAISGEFASGSTFKLFVAYAALAEHIVTEHTSFVSSGGIGILQWYFPDWKAGGHGVTDVRKAIAESVNTYFYIIGGGFESFTGLGVDRITEYAAKFGFGDQTGIDLPGENDGFLPSKDWKEEYKGERWYVGDTYHLAIGQGDVLVTPLQIALGTAAIANGGFVVTPYIVEAIDGAIEGYEFDYSKKPVEELDEYAVQVVQQGMRQTVTRGSAQYLQYLSEDVAGKTGTAQTPGDRPTHAWFTGYGPYEDPEIVITVLVEEGGEGSSVAVPIARDIFEWWFLNR
jgi:penicillin-binding protein 2